MSLAKRMALPMHIAFSAIFILSLAAGGAFGYINQMSLAETLVCLVIAGFIGSSLIGMIFTYLYFLQKETDPEKIKRLQQEINQLKQIKRIEP